MTKTTPRFAALVLSALVSVGVVVGMNGLATSQYAAAERTAQASGDLQQVAVQRVVIVGHRRA